MIEVLELQYTPKGFTVLAGLSQNLQRDWRRRGLMPPLEYSQSEYSPHDAAVARLMRLGPTEMKGIAVKAADHLLRHLFARHPDSWDFPGGCKKQDWAPKIFAKMLDLVSGMKARELKRYAVVPQDGKPFLTNNLETEFKKRKLAKVTVVDLEVVADVFAKDIKRLPPLRTLVMSNSQTPAT